MADRASEITEKLQFMPDNEALVRKLKDQKHLLFIRVSVITDERVVLYDSHTKRLLGPIFSQTFVVEHPEVIEAMEKGLGYSEDYSELLGQKLCYLAKAFDFHGKRYVIRTAFPYKYIVELKHDFEIGFLLLASCVLLLFSFLTWIIINHLSSPIRQIIKAIKPYQEGLTKHVPEIVLKSTSPNDDFGRLATTLNSLSEKIQNHINTLTSERNEKEAILESLVEGVVAVDSNLMVKYANKTALQFLRCSKSDLVNKPFSASQHHRCYELLMSCQEDNKVYTDAIQLKQEGGNKLFLHIVAVPKSQSNGAILVLQDKSSQYKIIEMRKDFIANASHELKTPITIIRRFAETLQDNPDLPYETVIEITQKIVRNCQRMTALIKNLLTLADIENLPLSRLQTCNLSSLLEGCKQTVLTVYPHATIDIQNREHEELFITADPELLEQAFTNLLDNASKYSKEHPVIQVHIEKNEGFAKITIADNGLGISANDLEHIFQRFYTVNKAHSKKMGGSGLGLSIVETIIDKHFGKISVESVLGNGTTFTIILPLNLEKILSPSSDIKPLIST